MDQNNQQLEQRVAQLEKQLAALQNSSTIPYNIDKSFVGRGYAKVSKPVVVVVGEDQGNWLNNVINLSGDPETIFVTQFPSAFGIVTEGEMAGYWIPLYVPPRIIA